MNDFLAKAQKITSFGAILVLGIGLGVITTSQNHFSDPFGLVCLGGTLFLAGGAYAYYTVRQKQHQETL
jgi:hypothetical protein